VKAPAYAPLAAILPTALTVPVNAALASACA